MTIVANPFDRCFRAIVNSEGVFDDDPQDSGNWTGGQIGLGQLEGTKYGISAAAYPNLGIRGLSLEDARAIYLRDYWTRIRADEYPNFTWQLLMFDCAVNQGVPSAIILLQDAVGVTVDGKLGPRTLTAMRSGDDRRPARFMALRALRYQKHPKFARFGYGWFTRLFATALEAPNVP